MNPPTKCSECPFTRSLGGNRYVCTVAATANDVVMGHFKPSTDCKSKFNNLEQAQQQKEEIQNDINSASVPNARHSNGSSVSISGRTAPLKHNPAIKPLSDFSFMIQSEKEKDVFYRAFPVGQRCSCPAYVRCKHLKRFEKPIKIGAMVFHVKSKIFVDVDVYIGAIYLGKILFKKDRKVYIFVNKESRELAHHKEFGKLFSNVYQSYTSVV